MQRQEAGPTYQQAHGDAAGVAQEAGLGKDEASERQGRERCGQQGQLAEPKQAKLGLFACEWPESGTLYRACQPAIHSQAALMAMAVSQAKTTPE